MLQRTFKLEDDSESVCLCSLVEEGKGEVSESIVGRVRARVRAARVKC